MLNSKKHDYKIEIKELEKEIKNNENIISELVMKTIGIKETDSLYKAFLSQIELLSNKNDINKKKISDLEYKCNCIIESKEKIDTIYNLFENVKKFYKYSDFEGKKKLIQSVIKFAVFDSKTNILDIIPIGSSIDKSLYFSNKSRRNGTCRNDCYNGISAYE